MPTPAKSPRIRFARHVNIKGPVVRPDLGACHLWTGARSGKRGGTGPDAYGVFGWDSKQRAMRAHRAAWLIHRGAIPRGLSVLHKCDTPLCVNPAHLFLGTQLTNMRDRQAKGRWAGGRPQVLTSEQRAQVVRRVNVGESTRTIARTLGVSRGAILNAIKETRGATSHV